MLKLMMIGCAIVLALSACGGSEGEPSTTPTPSVESTASPGLITSYPQWHPGEQGFSFCTDEPETVPSGEEWQVSASSPVKPKEVVQLGIRSKFGTDTYVVYVRLIESDGTSYTALTTFSGNDFGYVDYPNDFGGAPPLSNGRYTIVWEDESGALGARVFLACGGFDVEP